MIQAGILQPIDYSGRVQQAFSQGQQQRREMETDNALRALAANPNDPEGLANLTRHNPQLGFRLQEQNREREAKAREERVQVFGSAARMAKNAEQWDLIADKLVELGYSEAAAAKGKFSPETRSAYMAAAGLKDDDRPADADYYYWLKETFPNSDFADRYLAADIAAKERQAEGSPIVANNGDGTFTIIPRSMVGQPQQAQGEVPPLPPGFVLDGGPTPPASGGFPGH